MVPPVEKRRCYGCGACVLACPVGALSLKRDPEGFDYPVVDGAHCTGCGRCSAVCPALGEPERRSGQAFALRALDGDLLQASSSGGAFSLIAWQVLEHGGKVAGAVFASDYSVRHELSVDLRAMRKSKYVQSRTLEAYREVLAALADGIDVLYSGTPCQCLGMRRLSEHLASQSSPAARGTLTTVSIVCRGVSSPAFWEAYVRWLEGEGNLAAFDFRDKRAPDARMVSWTADGDEHRELLMANGYVQLFLRGISMRPCCYSCPFCDPAGPADFTIGDFLGIEQIFPDLADGRGTSLVIARGRESEELIRSLADSAIVREASPESIAQPSLTAPLDEPFLRRFFFRDLANHLAHGDPSMELLLRKYTLPLAR